MAAVPSIPEFYSGQKIFITGGTGFMGKVLIEKLLRSCPDLHTIYLLIRPKKGKLPQDRIQDFTRQALFDTIRRDEPGAFDKLRAIAGDVKELGLGLSVEDKEMLQREVSIVFHSAASVRFDNPFNDAVLMNVRGTREVVYLALGMDKLKVFLHLSTAFANVCEHGHAVEKIYPPPRGWDWKTAIKLAEKEGTEDFVNCLTPKILGAFIPNTYVFTKALADQIINDYRDRLPLVLVRPSIVVGIFGAPLSGWSDNLNGPYGIWLGAYAGFISADSDLPVYNCTSMCEPTCQEELNETLTTVASEYPTTKMVWYPQLQFTKSRTLFLWHMLLFHVPYSSLMDAMLKYKGLKPLCAKNCRRIYASVLAMDYFISINLSFDNSEFLRLADNMKVCDVEDFGYTKVWSMDREAIKMILMGLRVNVLQDPIETMPAARRKYTRLYWLDKLVSGSFYLALFWALSSTKAFHSVAALLAW